jgi:hypothetical protein
MDGVTIDDFCIRRQAVELMRQSHHNVRRTRPAICLVDLREARENNP